MAAYSIITTTKQHYVQTIANWGAKFALTESYFVADQISSHQPMAKILSSTNNGMLQVFTTTLSYLIISKLHSDKPELNFIKLVHILIPNIIQQRERGTERHQVSDISSHPQYEMFFQDWADLLLQIFALSFMKSQSWLLVPLCVFGNELFMLI